VSALVVVAWSSSITSCGGKPLADIQRNKATVVAEQVPDQAATNKCVRIINGVEQPQGPRQVFDWTVVRECARIMRGEGKKTPEAYSNETDCTKALTAAWHLYVQPGLTDQPELGEQPTPANQPAQPQKFLRFVEGRTGVPVPLRWQLAVIG